MTIRTGPLRAALAVIAVPIVMLAGIYTYTVATYYRALRAGPAFGTVTYRANRTITPGAVAPQNAEPAASANVCHFEVEHGRVKRILNADRTGELAQCDVTEIVLTTNGGGGRSRPLAFSEIPVVLVNAVLGVEDKRFFEHAGFDPLRTIKAALKDLESGRKAEGASTLTQQLARNMWLDRTKNWLRKTQELMLSFFLESTSTKQEIFATYANRVPLGAVGPVQVYGFGEAAECYAGKDISGLSIAEAALIAGMIQRPSHFDPYHHPDRAKKRRDTVLKLMRNLGYISDAEFAAATAQRVNARASARCGSVQESHFLRIAGVQAAKLRRPIKEVSVTLDLDAQQAAKDAVARVMPQIDAVARRPGQGERPEAALVAIDVQTGAVVALVGGRDFSVNQVNHATSPRQPGSVFKPFVFAAALTVRRGSRPLLTPASILVDAPTPIVFGSRTYTPKNFHDRYLGPVTAMFALTHSLNNPAVSVAESVGYEAVRKLALDCGLNSGIKATPSMALGSYEVSLLEITAAYSCFANAGTYVPAEFVTAIDGKRTGKDLNGKQPAIDPRVAFIVTDMMREVLRSGTAAAAKLPFDAAGKTGTSRDSWFIGFSTRLICGVWVGFDSGHDLGLEGAKAAAPIWAEFMRRMAARRSPGRFEPPAGVVSVVIDPISGGRATPACPREYAATFLEGTEPAAFCAIHGSR